MKEILNIAGNKGGYVWPTTDFAAERVLGYYDFTNPDQDSGTVYEHVSKSLLQTNVQKSTVKSIVEGLTVGQYTGSEFVNHDQSEGIGGGEFTVEAWCRVPSTHATATLVALSNMGNQGGNSNRIAIAQGSTGALYAATGYGSTQASTTKNEPEQWNHWSLMRISGVSYLTYNGAVVKQFNHPNVITHLTWCVGGYLTGTRRLFVGQIAAAAVSAKARYNVAGFTPKFPLFD